MATLLPLPQVAVTVRPATMDDLAFIDGLQKLHTKQVGWMPTKTLEGKIALGHVLIAQDERHERVGYCIGTDRYFKRDDVGIIYQMNVVPGKQRGLIGATLVKAQFERSAYGCRLYCCWCAQDIAANKFWEAMGFTALAFRSGSASKGRMHIFWQKRIRSADASTPWWFPSQTTGGSIREDRVVLPIPPDTHWSDAKPIVLPGMAIGENQAQAKRLAGKASPKTTVVPEAKTFSRVIGGALVFGAPAKPDTSSANAETPSVRPERLSAKAKREPRVKQKNDPKLVAAARELRDRWLEHVNAESSPKIAGKYDVSRAIASEVTVKLLKAPPIAGAQKLFAA